MKNYFRINEISKLYGISPDTLRYYEKLGLLSPARSENGYRLYGLKDMWRLNVIRDLRALDIPMESIRAYLINRSTSTTHELLTRELSLLDTQIENLTRLKNDVKTRLQTIDRALSQPCGVIEQAFFSERRYFSIREGYTEDEQMDMLIRRLLNRTKEYSVIGNNRIGSFVSPDQKSSIPYTGVFMISKNGNEVFPAGTYLTVTHKGDINENSRYIPLLFEYASANGLTPIGELIELLWVDIHTASDRREHLTELQLFVE
ncbi:MAG: MerR family transcriptional regulator [Christensenellaceae bacterium]|jgi:DNA-binding transcriptional MerR regulator